MKLTTGLAPLTRAPTADAAEAFDRALDQLLRATGDPLVEIGPVLSEHPTFAMGHVLRAAIGVLAKDASALPLVAESLSAVGRAGGSLTDHERRHLAAAHAWLTRDPELAAERYAAILRDWPRDLLALRLAQSCYFFVGQTPALREVVDLVMPAWRHDMPGFEYLLAMAAFGSAENGDTERAETLGRWAVEIEPVFPFAIHAVAHALHARRDFAGGKLWLRQREAQWLTEGRMVAHIACHLAQFEVALGEHAHALAVLDQLLIPESVKSASSAADAAALLWRLQLDGIDPGSRWQALSDYWEVHNTPGFWPFFDLHAAIAYNASGDFCRAQQLARAITARARGNSHAAHLARTVTLPGLHAIEAFAAEAYASAYVMLQALRPALGQIGASQVQVSLFDRMRVEAKRRCRRATSVSMQPVAA